MSPDELPEDVSLWPKDLHELFNLSPGYSRDDLKRSYNRLIRRFRPEHHPEPFRRIREAYDFLQTFNSVEPAFTFIPPSVVPISDSPTAAAASAHPVEKPIDYWQIAIDGQASEAHDGLKRLIESGQATPLTFAQIYWLEVLCPEIEARGPAIHRLYEGIQQFGWIQPLAELLRRELEANPQEAMQPGYEQLRRCPGPQRGCPLWHEFRCRALAAIPNLNQMVTDLCDLEEYLQDYDDNTLFAIVCRMFDYAAWSIETEPVIDRATLPKILYRLNQFEIRAERNQQIDRCESLLIIRKAWSAVRGHNKSVPYIFRILGDFWIDGSVRYSDDWFAFLNSVDRRAFQWLETFDSIAGMAPVFLSLLNNALSSETWRREDFGEYRSSPWLKKEMRRQYDRLDLRSEGKGGRNRYFHLRAALVNLCMIERIPFDWAIRAFRESAEERQWKVDSIIEQLESDLAARCVCLAYRIAGLL